MLILSSPPSVNKQSPSPFRYPGGKSWLLPLLNQWYSYYNCKCSGSVIVEPFCGGAAVSLFSILNNWVSKAIMVEVDPDVSAVWKTILGANGDWLTERISQFDLSPENVNTLLQDHLLSSEQHIAFKTILKNRVSRGGVIAPGSGRLNKGEKNKGISSRWYPQTLIDRIEKIQERKNDITFYEDDGITFLKKYVENQKDSFFFIDPPYYEIGRRLYKHHEIDHEILFHLVSQLVQPYIVTYNDHPYVRNLIRLHRLTFIEVGMRNSHNSNK